MRNQQTLLPMIEGYKIFNKDLTCRNFQFEVGKRIKLPNEESLELCKNGFHFCPQPSGVWAYYSEGRVFKVRAYGVLDLPLEAGADYKMVCEEIELYEEVTIDGCRNTGDSNTGDRNTGNGNTGDRNTGDSNTGHYNTGDSNTGDSNTGHYNTGDRNAGNYNTGHYNTGCRNTGDRNTGDRNTGDRNTGNGNTGDRNTGNGNACNNHAGSLNIKEPALIMFDKKVTVPRESVDWYCVNRLGEKLMSDSDFDYTPYLGLPNASEKAIRKLHDAHIVARRVKRGEKSTNIITNDRANTLESVHERCEI